METQDIIRNVQEALGLNSEGEAEAVVRATLQTVAERISHPSVEELAGSLPNELAEIMRSATPAHPESFPLDEFYHRVANRTGHAFSGIEDEARAVIEVLKHILPRQEVRELLWALPKEYQQLLRTPSDQPPRLPHTS